MNAFLAAPASGLPFLPIALPSHSLGAAVLPPSHFFMNAVLAAPASGLPLLLTAYAAQLSAAGAAAIAGALAGAGVAGAWA